MGREKSFPTTLIGAVKYFDDEAVCRDFLASLRWPAGVRCFFCESERVGKITRTKDRYGHPYPNGPRVIWRCKDCRKEFSVTRGTIFEDSPIPLSKWFPCIWLITAGKKSRSSHQLAKDLGVTQRTAWFMAHRIRLIMETDDPNPFSGEVEADETLLGGKDRFKHAHLRRGPWGPMIGKTAVMALLERHGEGTSQVRAKMVADRKSGTLQLIVRRNVEKGSLLYTDAHRSYIDLAADYIHEVVDHAEEYVRDRVSTNGLENFFSLLRRVIYGTHHHVQPFHLDRYLAENTRKFNERHMTDAGRFTKTATRIAGRRLTWKELTGKLEPKGSAA